MVAAEAPAAAGDQTARAEVELLRTTVDRQNRQIQSLQARVRELTQQLADLGIDAGAPTTRPASGGKPKRVVFVVDCRPDPEHRLRATEEVLKAIDELDKDQWFNVVIQPADDAIPLSKTFLLPTPANRKRAEDLLKPAYFAYGRGDLAFRIALQWRPDVIWYVGRGGPYPEKLVSDVAALNAKTKVRINSTVLLAEPRETGVRHVLWQLAHDSGGECVDADGKPLAEPSIPVHVAPPAPKPPAASTRPSSLRVR
jgi:hypothetical protein